ncbi:MAG: hypothetical protein COZ34_01930 [Candidatus Pacebacteria bacterium CG_4_10_14_3_um_filter_34_15]|nr:hypothetical protein [Candidatus Pacearchaeota archaeon]NCQ65361.1 hypothetical protein [Candidatus Paceibacterota bacterium]NCS87100.1 hypothetical protein [Candidatus Paceibacterota bacterium]OIO45356.1 MAG: hypothetical protein AUJ41_00340 [Candidatus Pacebacteria bacterium CG1_02_43_31]PIX81680.1 MAG: hypothetical protein COZ34_01930 [Candidatus Pacebacteria bacterium CG_4_10_14_3_um_filter_34_15]
MRVEKLAEDFIRIFSHKEKAQKADYIIKHEPIPSPVSPWKVIIGESLRDRALTAEMEKGFNPRFPGTSDLYPLADAGGRWFSKPEKNKKGNSQSSIWLNPDIWQSTLDEFAHFADYFNKQISFLVNWDISTTHRALTQQGYISVTPVLIDSQGFSKSDIIFGISDEGRVNVGSVSTGFKDLGYLNPHRENKAVRSRLIETLRLP